MTMPKHVTALSFLVTLSFLICSASSDHSVNEKFLECFSSRTKNNSTRLSDILVSPNSSNYLSVLQSTIRNSRFIAPSIPKPAFIITPKNESHIQAAIVCGKENGMQLRTRSGGHDNKGLSYISYDESTNFFVIDLCNLRSIDIDIENESAWVEAGASLGEVYYQVAKKSNVHAFNAATAPTVGVGGHISGGGLGNLNRKHGVAADNVIDAKMVDADGRIIDRSSMGEDVFWAIRGGGGASFGIILSWKLKLFPVPPIVTFSNVTRKSEQGGDELFHKWQTIAHQLPRELYLRCVLSSVPAHANENSAILVSFYSVYLGDAESLVRLMRANFPELSLKRENCNEISWIQSVLFFYSIPIDAPLDVFLDRKLQTNSFYKSKSDFVKEAIPQSGLQGLCEKLLQVADSKNFVIMSPFGGRMDEISESETPFPHRNGILYQVEYRVECVNEEKSHKYLQWMRNVYSYMEPYVSKSPRQANFNFRDLDLGMNNNTKGNTSFEEASVWGYKVFKNNFKRLAKVKAAIDPSNFFRNEQSIPPLF